MKETIKILFIGDVIGLPGRTMLQKHLPQIRQENGIDAVIVNGENSDTRGRGLTSRIMHFFKHIGVDVVTSGNHIWANNQIVEYISSNTDLLRPANFPGDCPGSGVTVFECAGVSIGVINVQGRIFMRELLACPFRTTESLLTFLKNKAKVIIVDFHAEATSEKKGMGYFFDGRVSAVIGTHSHVQTADNRILPHGTAYITDAGMVGAMNSMIGMKKEGILQHFLTQMPVRFTVETQSPIELNGVIIEVDTTSGKARSINRLHIIDPDIHIEE